jgi:hypothetical protein
LVILEGDAKISAARRKSPRYAPVSYGDETFFVDLDHIATVDKVVLATMTSLADIDDEDAERRFRRDIGRRSTRFAFPDDVVPWFKPLVEAAYSRKPTGAEGRVFEKVAELRVESANGWLNAPYNVTLTVIVEAGELPAFPGDDLPDISDDLTRKIRPKGELVPSSRIAELLDVSIVSEDKYFLWQAMSEAWAAQCRPKDSELRKYSEAEAREIRMAVAGRAVTGETVSIDEYSLARYYASEQLDLAHLSSPI